MKERKSGTARSGHEDDVGRAVERGHFLAGHGVPERHVVEGERAGLRLQGVLLRALADEEEVEAGIRPQALRDVQDPRERVADAVGAAVEHHEPVAEPEAGAQVAVRRPRLERLEVDAVRDDVELRGVDPASRDVGGEGVRHRHHGAAAPVEEELEELQGADDGAAPDDAQVGEDRRPEVPDLEHERHAEPARDHPGRDDGEEGRGRGHQHVRAPQVRRRLQDGLQHEDEVAERAQHDAAVRRRVGPAADHPQAVDLLDLERSPAVGLGDDPGRVVREVRDDRDLVALRHPLAPHLEKPRARRAQLRPEVVAEKGDPQGRAPAAASGGRRLRRGTSRPATSAPAGSMRAGTPARART